jgi:hypothetical protein
MTRLRHECERAKIALSERSSAAVYVGSFFRGVEDESLDHKLTREQLETIVGPLLDKGLSRITSILEMAGVSPAQISLCLAVGGMANMPAIRARLHEWFGVQRVHVSNKSASLIAEGAAWIAHDDARLQLAKPIELVLARNALLPVIAAGTEMPLEGETRRADALHLYCVDPRDGIAKFQFQTPFTPGRVEWSEPRRVLCILTIPVDGKAQPFREHLELDSDIDENLILTVQARSLMKSGLAEAKIHDLEFALKLPGFNNVDNELEEASLSSRKADSEKGTLAIRANVSNRSDDTLVPGDLLYKYNPKALDPELRPPQIQLEEFLYYQPCSYCRRSSNDPLCRCASEPSVRDRHGVNPQ